MTDFKKIEKKWQRAWEKKKIFEVKEDNKKKKYYLLEMFPYPSSTGLHMGHAFNYTLGDTYSRFKRMQGFNVLYPMGYDSFGLPAENAAIKAGIHPKKFTEDAIKNFIKQQKSLGLSYAWNRMLMTHHREYYKWNQYFFLEFYKKGLVYRKKAPVNWCPECKTVLANEQVHDGRCWRHKDSDVEIKQLEQWFIKITQYAEELLDDIEGLEWPERIKIMQRNWIGKSYGTEIDFEIAGKKWLIFTTRPDTIYGVTFMVISAQHPKLMSLVTQKQKKDVEAFLKKIKSTSEKNIEELEKEGAFTGSYATNPLTKEKVPIWVGNFVVAEYGSGMVMAVPAHDQRDFEFAKKYSIPIKVVIEPEDHSLNTNKMTKAFTDEGKLINSEKFNKIQSKDAIEEITNHLEEKKLGRKTVQYKLKDWLISRQRYWGTPIPFVYCNKCGLVPEVKLPVLLPEAIKFGKGNPLETNTKFVNTKCPRCKGKARRETDTMDTFFDSSWYFLRYCDNKNSKEPFKKERVKYWMPVDQYIGGAEHACMHLIYARFFTKALRDLSYLKINEPFKKLFNQGMLHGEDGYVMSKSRGNVVIPEEVSNKYGIDTARLFLVSIASPDKDIEWSEKGIEGSSRFINKIVNYFKTVKKGQSDRRAESKFNKFVKEVTLDIEEFRYNLAVIKIREMFDSLKQEECKEILKGFLKIISLFCPHIAEELWHQLGNKTFISLEKWPEADKSKIDKSLEKEEQQIESTLKDVRNILSLMKEKQNKEAKLVYLYTIPNELKLYKEAKDMIEQSLAMKVHVHAVNDKDKYDPQNKSTKAKPGKPAIYLE